MRVGVGVGVEGEGNVLPAEVEDLAGAVGEDVAADLYMQGAGCMHLVHG